MTGKKLWVFRGLHRGQRNKLDHYILELDNRVAGVFTHNKPGVFLSDFNLRGHPKAQYLRVHNLLKGEEFCTDGKGLDEAQSRELVRYLVEANNEELGALGFTEDNLQRLLELQFKDVVESSKKSAFK